MFEIKIDEEELKSILLEEINKKLKKFENEAILLDSKKLCKLLSLSWPTIERTFLHNPNFPKARVGTKWVFNRKKVQVFIDNWSNENQF